MCTDQDEEQKIRKKQKVGLKDSMQKDKQEDSKQKDGQYVER